MSKPKRFIRIIIIVFLGLAFLYMERANNHRSDFQDAVSQFYHRTDKGQVHSLELYAKRMIVFKDSDWTFSESDEVANLNLNDMSSRESLDHIYEIKEKISDDLNHKIRVIHRLFFGLFIASVLILYTTESRLAKKDK